ncbi:coiled-coil domain-containing protein 86-like [Rhopilema esculentum]|uniref:coiled-coil domain-containing protein 86-like n=1 Tax=Rhopilema esculentum TaxID=499914 RepID=UPI0031D02590|eukprot:gene15383-6617_t
MKTLKGKPKSGRLWKSEKKRKCEMINVKALHSTWAKRQKKRAEESSIRAFEKELKDAAIQAKEEKRKKMEERKKRREENIKKAEIVQEIKNTSKLKRLKKKQLRLIEKR